MAVVQGIREKIHSPIYDSLTVKPGEQLRDAEPSSTLRFFVNVQRKTKLETNLQSASLLPHYNTFEARAMRVVISDLPAEFSDKVELTITGSTLGESQAAQDMNTNLKRAMELLEEARAGDPEQTTTAFVDKDKGNVEAETGGTEVEFTVGDLEDAILDLAKDGPPKEQVRPNNGVGTLMGKLIYNTVTTFYVGEKVMIQMPTWFFPSGAGPYSEATKFSTHGEPNPTATFRFAEPIYIDKQQNFRVEIEIPDTDTLKEIQKIYGPLFIWVVLDGYMTRDVQ